MQLRKLERLTSPELKLVWDDGREDVVSLRDLREACPCASCKGETVLLHHVGPARRDENTPGRYELTHVEPIGHYALKLTWGDAHADGIYSWDVLRRISEAKASEE